jgi:hypothetical protein
VAGDSQAKRRLIVRPLRSLGAGRSSLNCSHPANRSYHYCWLCYTPLLRVQGKQIRPTALAGFAVRHGISSQRPAFEPVPVQWTMLPLPCASQLPLIELVDEPPELRK